MKSYKNFWLLTAIAALAISAPVNASSGFKGESFEKVFYFSGASGKGAHSGLSAANAKAISSADIMSIDAGMVISKVFVIVDTALTGTTSVKIGDDDLDDGFVRNQDLSLSTVGLQSWSAKTSGAYLRVQTAGATDAADIYVVPNAKYYSAAGKEIKLATVGTNTAGAIRVVVQGIKLNL